MRKLFIISALLCSVMLKGQDASQKNVRTENVDIQLTADSALQISMDVVLPVGLKVSSNRMMIFTPIIKKSAAETPLTPIYVYGRKREIINKRKNRLPIEGSQIVRRTNHKEQVIAYTTTLPYASWMEKADVLLEENLCGCDNHTEENKSKHLAQVALTQQPMQQLVAETTTPTVKEKRSRRRIYEGKAFIYFPVSKTIIYPNYRKNPTELSRIDSTLTMIGLENISRIILHGYASPESSYALNTHLALERTKSLKAYIIGKFNLNDSIFTTNSTPEDWEGLIRLAEACNWKDKELILKIARSDAEPDEKEKQLKQLEFIYPEISKHWFPTLRHTDYSIEFNEIIEDEE